jgi:NADH-quinone oxidoreductase subunit M
MVLVWLIGILMGGGLLAWIAGKWNQSLPRWISLAAVLTDFALALYLWAENPVLPTAGSAWLMQFTLPWIPQWGIGFSLALDGLSLLMLLLTFFLGALGILVSWTEITDKVGFFHFNLLWVLAGITGVFLTADLFLFYFFWEVMLIPMYFLIGIWGHANRMYAAYKFFLFTQASGLLMLVAILGVYFVHGSLTGNYTFNYFELLGTAFSPVAGRWLMAGFLAAFLVKLPVVPFHAWLPDAHSEAPTAGSVVLAGLLLKTGAYGLLRFVVPLFPAAAQEFAPWAMLLGVVGILYGAVLAFSQTDLKRLVAYTSVSHMGFVILGVFAYNPWALQGVVMQMITHGISTGALFILAGFLYQRLHTRDIRQMGGFWAEIPKMGTVGPRLCHGFAGLTGPGQFHRRILNAGRRLAGGPYANGLCHPRPGSGYCVFTAHRAKDISGPRSKSFGLARPFGREMLVPCRWWWRFVARVIPPAGAEPGRSFHRGQWEPWRHRTHPAHAARLGKAAIPPATTPLRSFQKREVPMTEMILFTCCRW